MSNSRVLFLASKAFVSTLLLACASLASADSQPVTLKGTISLWSREVACTDEMACDAPQSLGISWPAEVTYTVPSTTGRSILADQTYTSRNWQVHLLMVFVRPESGATPYIVTQIRLREKLLGILAECSRYDGINDFKFLPPGACAGRDGAKTYGVSFLAP